MLYSDDDNEDTAETTDVVEGLVIRSLVINTKSLQETTISFRPDMPDQETVHSRHLSWNPISNRNKKLNISDSEDSLPTS